MTVTDPPRRRGFGLDGEAKIADAATELAEREFSMLVKLRAAHVIGVMRRYAACWHANTTMLEEERVRMLGGTDLTRSPCTYCPQRR